MVLIRVVKNILRRFLTIGRYMVEEAEKNMELKMATNMTLIIVLVEFDMPSLTIVR